MLPIVEACLLTMLRSCIPEKNGLPLLEGEKFQFLASFSVLPIEDELRKGQVYGFIFSTSAPMTGK